MTSLQLSNFIKLGAMDRVVGITSTRFLFNKDMQRQVDEGLTRRIGIEGNFDNEVIMSINPDLMLISPFKRGGYDAVKDIGNPAGASSRLQGDDTARSGRVDQVCRPIIGDGGRGEPGVRSNRATL